MSNKKEKLVREFNSRAAFDKRDPDPKKNYGIHGCDLWFAVKGKKGAAVFMMNSGWFLPETIREYHKKGQNLFVFENKFAKDGLSVMYPMSVDIGIHSKKNIFYGEIVKAHGKKSCNFTGGKCFYDGSAISSEKFMNILISEGSEKMWAALEKYYHDAFYRDKRHIGLGEMIGALMPKKNDRL